MTPEQFFFVTPIIVLVGLGYWLGYSFGWRRGMSQYRYDRGWTGTKDDFRKERP
jgi:hypothetical protein